MFISLIMLVDKYLKKNCPIKSGYSLYNSFDILNFKNNILYV